MNNAQELAVINEVLDGQSDQYRQLVERYHRGLIQHLYNMIHDDQLAEDLAQEAFIRAYDKLNLFNPSYAFSTWLYKIADNIAYKHLGHTKNNLQIEEVENVLPDNKPSLPEKFDLNLTKEVVRNAVKELPPTYRQVISLYYWENFNYEEIASIMDHPVGTIRTWLYRAKEQLRKELYGQV